MNMKTIEYILQIKANGSWFNSNTFDNVNECKDILKHKRKMEKDRKFRAVKRTISEKVL